MSKIFLIAAFLLLSMPLSAQSKIAHKIESPCIVVNELEAKPAVHKVLAKAEEFLGTPYKFGNKNKKRTDCSGFTQQVFQEFGISLPRSATEQAKYGTKIDIKDLKAGDLLFYRTYKKGPSHVAIYAGDGKIIHASSTAKRVQYDAIDKRYYRQRFLYAKRIVLNEENPSLQQN